MSKFPFPISFQLYDAYSQKTLLIYLYLRYRLRKLFNNTSTTMSRCMLFVYFLDVYVWEYVNCSALNVVIHAVKNHVVHAWYQSLLCYMIVAVTT